MKEEILEGDNGADVYFATGISMAMSTRTERQAQPTRPIRRDKSDYQGEYIPWGEDNLHPYNTIETIEKNDILPAVIDFKVRALTSGGMQYGDHYSEGTEEIFEPRNIPEVEDFLEMIEHDNYLEEATTDFYTHANHFPELVMNVGRKVVGLYCDDAAFVRLGVPVENGRNRGKILDVYVGADWRDSLSIENAERIAAIDPYYRVVDQLRERKEHKFVIPSRAQSKGRLDYQRGPVESLIASHWLDIDCSIPLWKKTIMEDQMSVKYHLEVNDGYWKRRWKDWDAFDETKKKKLKKDTFREFIDFFKGAENAGNALITPFHQMHDKEWSDWKVTLLENKTWQNNAYIEDSTQSTAHIIMSQGVDHTLHGLIPGKGFSAGSGSDKRVAFNQHVLLCQPHQRKILRPFDYIAELNGWNKRYGKENRRLKFWFKNTFIATLDHGKETKSANENNTKKT